MRSQCCLQPLVAKTQNAPHENHRWKGTYTSLVIIIYIPIQKGSCFNWTLKSAQKIKRKFYFHLK